MNLSTEALAYFTTVLEDCFRLAGGNWEQGYKENGYLTDLKKKGLLYTFADHDEKCVWVYATQAGLALAADLGIGVCYSEFDGEE